MTAVSAGTLFVDLDDAERSELAGRLRPFSVAADEVLFRQDTPADRVYLVTAGRRSTTRATRRSCRLR